MKLAFDNVEGALVGLTKADWEAGILASRESERRRIILPLHRQQDAPVQRILNFLQPGTYIRPHRHPRPGASESLVILQGAIRFITFDNSGKVVARNDYSSQNSSLIDIEPNVWHTFLVLEPDTVLFECKLGPYDVVLDKTFAPWAPSEGTEAAAIYMVAL